MILQRADWILESSIRAACGYVPRLPPDLIDFTGADDEMRMVPELKPLTDLLKAVAPAMKLEDDRNAIIFAEMQQKRTDESNDYQDKAEQVISLCLSGHLSHAESIRLVEQFKPMMELAARERIIKAMEAIS